MADNRLVKLGSIRWPIIPGEGWPITIKSDDYALPDLSVVVSATITWRSGTLEKQARALTFDSLTRTTTAIRASYAFTEDDLEFIQDAPSDIRGYVSMLLDDGSTKESAETIVLPLRSEFQ